MKPVRPWRSRQYRRESAQEIQTHNEDRIDELVESGMAKPEAAQQATREFGNALLLSVGMAVVCACCGADPD